MNTSLHILFFILIAITTIWLFIYVLNDNINYNMQLEPSTIDSVDYNTQLEPSSDMYDLNETERWIVLAGDSNMKFLWHRIIETFPTKFKEQIKSKTVSTGFYKDTNRWVDRDVIFYFKNNTKLRISLKFLHGGKNEFNRINNNWSDIRLCNDGCDHLKSPSFQDKAFNYTSKPDILWITHGLWALNPDLREDEADCYGSTPFSEYIHAAAKYIKSIKDEITVVWQTNPSIAWHPRIKKTHVKLDYLCQKQLAAEYKLALFDIYEYTDKDNHKHMEGTYHIDTTTQQYIIDRIFNRTFINSLQYGNDFNYTIA